MAYWANGGPLPNDNESLREIARCPSSEWARTKGLLQRFFAEENGSWRHKRIDQELSDANANYRRRVAQTEAARTARHVTAPVTDNVTENVSSHVTGVQSQSQSQSQSEPPPIKSTKLPTKSTKLSKSERELADRLESCLGSEWTNDAGKWIMRIRKQPNKSERVIAELESAVKEWRVATTPARFVEDTWGRFV